jgi:carboxypeptidase PM20D1
LTLTIIALALIGAWLAVILVRAALYKPPAAATGPVHLPGPQFDLTSAAGRLANLVRCRTIAPQSDKLCSEADRQGINVYEEYEKLRQLLKDYYPLTHQALTHELVKDHSLLYRWAGKSSEKPLLLMAHYDVVPANDAQWQQPPFAGNIIDGVIWGRGTLDTKCTLCAIFEAVEKMLAAGFEPQQDIYLAFGHDEETMGYGAPATVEVLKNRGVRFEMVLDEGGAIVKDVFPGISKPIAVIGMSEKGVADFEVVLEGSGGHSSTPGLRTPLGEMSKIILRLAKKPFQALLPVEVVEMFAVLGRHMPFGFRIIFANLWCFKPLLTLLLPKLGGELSALCRTTCVFTMIEGSSASNVIPNRVRAVANLRLAAIDPLSKALGHLTEQAKAALAKGRAAKDPLELKVNLIQGHDASPSSSTASEAYALLAETISATFPGTIVTPYIMMAASDSRHYCAICDNVLRFSPIQLGREELRSIHGNDEQIRIEKFGGIIEFYLALIGRS